MTTWANFLADIRAELKDTGATQRFSDDLLYLWTKDAINDYSMHFPRRMDRVELTASGGSYTLPSDYYHDIEVEYPLNTFLERRQQRPGQSYATGTTPTIYFVSGGKVYLNATPPTTIYLTYDAYHPSPASSADTTFVFTIQPSEEELLRLYIKAKASEQLRTQQAALDRFKLGSGDRQDNPLLPEYDRLMQEYRTKLAERYPGRSIRLYAPRRS